MWNSNLRSVTKVFSAPETVEVPEGFALVDEKLASIFGHDKYQLILGGKDITAKLDKGVHKLTFLNINQEIEFNKVISLSIDHGLKGRNFVKFLMTVRAKTTELTYKSAAIFKNYSNADPGFLAEFDQNAESIMSAINDVCNSASTENVEKVKKLVESSMLRVVRDYNLQSASITFTHFQ